MRARLLPLFGLLLLAASTSQVEAQKISITLRPRVGDTLRMAMDQEVEMSGTRRRAGGAGDSTRTTRTTLHVVTRAAVLSATLDGTTLIAEAESLSMSTSGDQGTATQDRARQRLLGRAVRLWMAPDGATKVVSVEAGAYPGMSQLFAQMPAMLPRDPVKVGAKWVKEMLVPATGLPGAGGTLRASFRLDSLSSDGDFAYVTISGVLEPPKGMTSAELGGTMSGGLVVDRRRGWLSDARTTMMLWSRVVAGVGAEPMAFRMRVSQRVRVVR